MHPCHISVRMRTCASVLACMACMGHGHGGAKPQSQLERKQDGVRPAHPAETLARLLLAFNTAAAWQLPSPYSGAWITKAAHCSGQPLGANTWKQSGAPSVVRCQPLGMEVFKVILKTPDGKHVFKCAGDQHILDAAEEQFIDLPYSCRTGSCSVCAGKVISGSVDQSKGIALDSDQQEEGFCLTCIAFPTSNVTIETHQEDELL